MVIQFAGIKSDGRHDKAKHLEGYEKWGHQILWFLTFIKPNRLIAVDFDILHYAFCCNQKNTFCLTFMIFSINNPPHVTSMMDKIACISHILFSQPMGISVIHWFFAVNSIMYDI